MQEIKFDSSGYAMDFEQGLRRLIDFHACELPAEAPFEAQVRRSLTVEALQRLLETAAGRQYREFGCPEISTVDELVAREGCCFDALRWTLRSLGEERFEQLTEGLVNQLLLTALPGACRFSPDLNVDDWNTSPDPSQVVWQLRAVLSAIADHVAPRLSPYPPSVLVKTP